MSLNTSNIRCPRRMPHLCISSIMKCYFNKIFHLSIAHRRHYSWEIRWIFVVLSCLSLMVNAQQIKTSSPRLKPAGWTVPEGEIIVKYGENLQIWCNLNETIVAKEYPGLNSWNIYFMSNGHIVEQKFITTINKTTALLTIKSPPAGRFMYFCVLDLPGDMDAMVSLNKVVVGFIPAKPAHLSVINVTSDSATLCWESPFPMNNFLPGLTHKVMYHNHWDYEKDWMIINIDTEPHLHKRCSTLTGLHANTAYDARVYLRSVTAVKENMYSKPVVTIFRTLPTLPSFPPRTDIGSFEIVENYGTRDVYLYWQMIQEYHENGNKFKYWVNHVEENDHKIVLEPIEITKTYAKFKGLSFNKYRFKIVSENEIGISKNYTEIIVPNQYEMPRRPKEFTKMAFERGLYELSWVPPIIHKDITNYTIFWCDNKRDRPYQCTGYLIHVSMNTTVYNITVPDRNKIYQFAISANTNKGSSGMKWSSCAVIRSKELSKMKFIWINRFGLDFIEVGWYLDCLDRIGVIEEVKIYYCPLVSKLVTKCKEPKRNISVKYHPYRTYGIVKNLTSFTTYKFELTMVTKYGESQPSKSLYQTTYETPSSTSS